ncbi:hypothetical protein LZ31DRAFT_307860 [Colletotrichum somersetense]|nr:hypothetical protein LZ31DRAFT_307860 [Colletotrichum somersetense]
MRQSCGSQLSAPTGRSLTLFCELLGSLQSCNFLSTIITLQRRQDKELGEAQHDATHRNRLPEQRILAHVSLLLLFSSLSRSYGFHFAASSFQLQQTLSHIRPVGLEDDPWSGLLQFQNSISCLNPITPRAAPSSQVRLSVAGISRLDHIYSLLAAVPRCSSMPSC